MMSLIMASNLKCNVLATYKSAKGRTAVYYMYTKHRTSQCAPHIFYMLFLCMYSIINSNSIILHTYIHTAQPSMVVYKIQYICKANTSTNAVQIHVQKCGYIRATNRKQTAVRNTDTAPRLEE